VTKAAPATAAERARAQRSPAALPVTRRQPAQARRPGVGGRGPLFAAALAQAYVSREYPPPFAGEGSAVGQGWGPHYDGRWVRFNPEEGGSEDEGAGDNARSLQVASVAAPARGSAGGEGGAGGGGKAQGAEFSWEFDPTTKINMRRFNVTVVQMGPHGGVHSNGLRIGVVAAKETRPAFTQGVLDRCWRSAACVNRAWCLPRPTTLLHTTPRTASLRSPLRLSPAAPRRAGTSTARQATTPPLPPSRTKWTRLVHPSVLTGHVDRRRPQQVAARRRALQRRHAALPARKHEALPRLQAGRRGGRRD